MKKLFAAVVLALFVCSPAWTCPSSGCVEIMQKPSGENWGYVNGLAGSESLAYDGSTVTAVEVVTDDNGADSGHRRVKITLTPSDVEEPVDASYSFRVKDYNSSGQLVSTSSMIPLATTTSGNCDETGTIGSTNCTSSYFTCFIHGCECKYECPRAGCITASAGCDFSLSEGCTCPYNWTNCDPFNPPCQNPQLVAEYNNTCPAGHTCVVDIMGYDNL